MRKVGRRKIKWLVQRTVFVKVRMYFLEERSEREDTGNEDGCLRK